MLDQQAVQAAIAMIKQERVALIPALQAVSQLAKTVPGASEHVDVLFLQLLDMQLKIGKKREQAKSLLREQPCALTEDGRSSYHCIRHIPDVTIRTLCAVAEIPHLTNAEPEWLDKMEEKHRG